MVILVSRLQFHFFLLLLCFNGLRYTTLCTVTYHHACNMVMMIYIYCVLQAFRCATQPHVMASMGASGPAGAWEIASTRIPTFISKPNEHRSSGGGFHWVAAFMRITI